MFVKIESIKGIHNALSYNEKKLKQGKATCLLAENFIKDTDQLNLKDKYFHFRRLTSLNDNSKSNGLHISINFHPADRLSSEDMRNIAREYMHNMKLGQQPYLVYRHDDTIHPHLHLVSTQISTDGSPIIINPEDFYKSQRLSQHFEKFYSLTSWRTYDDKRPNHRRHSLLHQPAQKIRYGRTASLPAINAVLEKVLHEYRYTSLPEFNAILRQYNIEAYPGKEGSWLRQHHGLLYRILDDNGKPTSSHIKASAFDNKPILSHLEKEFSRHQWDSHRQQHRANIATAIDWVLLKPIPDLSALQRALEKEKISMIIQKDRQYTPQNIFFIDQQTNAVFDSQRLDSAYQLTGLERRCKQSMPALIQKQEQTEVLTHRIRHRL